MSIISTILMLLLVLSEFTSYLEVKTGSEMTIDTNRGGEKVITKIFIIKSLVND